MFPAWYAPRAGDILFARVLTERAGDGVRAGLVSGPPGVGKTALAAALADVLGAEHIYFLAHHWVSEEDLFIRLDPARVAALAGGVEGVRMGDAYRPGVLLRAVEASRRAPAVLVLDEWNKSPSATAITSGLAGLPQNACAWLMAAEPLSVRSRRWNSCCASKQSSSPSDKGDADVD